MQIFTHDDVGLHYREDGDPAGRPVVFANSLGTELRLWDKVVALLPPGLRIIRFDKRGHGLSSCPTGPYRMEDLAGDTEALLDHLGVLNAVFIGCSVGGIIGQILAAGRPDVVKALVLSNSAARMGDPEMWRDRIDAIERGGIEALADPILERWFSADFRATDELTGWRNMLTRTPRDGYLACCHAIAASDLTASTAKLTLPTLGIGGSKDGASPSALVAATIALIPGARFVEIDGVGHLPCVEAPETVAALIRDFLKETRDA